MIVERRGKCEVIVMNLTELNFGSEFAEISAYEFLSGNAVLIGAAVLFLLISAFFVSCCFFLSMSGTASVKSLSENKSQSVIRNSLHLLEHREKYLGCAFAGAFVNSALAITSFYVSLLSLILPHLKKVIPDTPAYIVSSVLLIAIISFVFVCFVYFPIKNAVMADPEKKLLRFGRLFIVLSFFFLPISAAGIGVSRCFKRIFRRNGRQSPENETEERILMIVDEGEENGTIEEKTRSMIENVFDFDDTTVGEIMTHRKDIIAVKDEEPLSVLTKTAIESGRSRIPVYHSDIDNIIGIIYAKDLLKYVGVTEREKTIAKDILRKAVFVPESKSCSEMFKYMTANKIQIAVVVDEFGGTGGIITMEDLIESILGSIQDEYDDEDEEIKRVNEYSFSVDGATLLDEIEDLTGISFEGEHNDTIAGLMLDRMGHIPNRGEHPSIVINGTRFTVQEIDQQRISKVLIVKNHK